MGGDKIALTNSPGKQAIQTERGEGLATFILKHYLMLSGSCLLAKPGGNFHNLLFQGLELWIKDISRLYLLYLLPEGRQCGSQTCPKADLHGLEDSAQHRHSPGCCQRESNR